MLIEKYNDLTNGLNNNSNDLYDYKLKDEYLIILKPLKLLINRTKVLLTEYKFNALLLQISTIAISLCNLNINDCNLLKILSGLELLLKKIHKWQDNAFTTISLENYGLKMIRQIILKWRKIELNHWQNNLKYIQKKFNNQAKLYFYRLLQVIFFYQNNNLNEIYQIINEFILSSPIGELLIRMKLLNMLSNKKSFNIFFMTY